MTIQQASTSSQASSRMYLELKVKVKVKVKVKINVKIEMTRKVEVKVKLRVKVFQICIVLWHMYQSQTQIGEHYQQRYSRNARKALGFSPIQSADKAWLVCCQIIHMQQFVLCPASWNWCWFDKSLKLALVQKIPMELFFGWLLCPFVYSQKFAGNTLLQLWLASTVIDDCEWLISLSGGHIWQLKVVQQKKKQYQQIFLG